MDIGKACTDRTAAPLAVLRTTREPEHTLEAQRLGGPREGVRTGKPTTPAPERMAEPPRAAIPTEAGAPPLCAEETNGPRPLGSPANMERRWLGKAVKDRGRAIAVKTAAPSLSEMETCTRVRTGMSTEKGRTGGSRGAARGGTTCPAQGRATVRVQERAIGPPRERVIDPRR